jgi:PhzF family phenazine biosynthesis protein
LENLVPTPIFIVDAFAERPFQGNPAAVCPLDAPADEAWMQRVAAEMNLSETAFVVSKDGGFGLRWFTPRVEVDLCGHATLATAHLMWEQNLAPIGAAIAFQTRSGLLTCARRGTKIELDFPSEPAQPVPPSQELIAALDAEPLSVGRNRFDWIAEFAGESDVRQLQPDFGLLGKIPARGIIATARSSDPQFDFVSRFFAPAVGVDEDPVCGSAHCCLGPFWSDRLGKTELLGHQISARGGIIGVRLKGCRVLLSGTAVTVLRGTLTV